MASQVPSTTNQAFVLIGGQSGFTVIPSPTALTRLNFFDGKFLRAADLQLEQSALRTLVALSNQAGGAGVVYGFDAELGGGDRLEVSAGLAIDPAGRVLYLPQATGVGLTELIERSQTTGRQSTRPAGFTAASFGECELRAAAEPGAVVQGIDLYLITVGHAEAYCGEEDVFGKLCEEACVTSTDRPYVIEGVVMRAVPLVLNTPLTTSEAVALTSTHLRSQVASAYFADEQARVARLISREGLGADAWCLGALAAGGNDVPIALVARSGATTRFLDPWIPRRERMEVPPRRYWAWRMAMRPWNVFLAQILQFQCQLHHCFQGLPRPGAEVDPCREARDVAAEASAALEKVTRYMGAVARRFTEAENLAAEPGFGGITALRDLHGRLAAVAKGGVAALGERVLIRCGIVELPSAGYLPVVPEANLSVNQQVRQFMGEGVELRFCVVRPDFVAHALEEAQHMERISLLRGLDDPAAKPAVDVLVPDGEIVTRTVQQPALAFRGTANLVIREEIGDRTISAFSQVRGAGRAETLPAGGGAFYFAGVGDLRVRTDEAGERLPPELGRMARRRSGIFAPRVEGFRAAAPVAPARLRVAVATPVPRFALACWISLRCEHDPFTMALGESTAVSLLVVIAATSRGSNVFREVRIQGSLDLESSLGGANEQVLTGRFPGVTRDRRRDSGQGVEQEVEGFEFHARLRLQLGTTSSRLKLELQDSAEEDTTPFHPVVSWSGEPMEARLQENTGEAFITAARLQEDAAVLAPEDSDHALALTALEAVGAALEDPRFVDHAARLLFPEQSAPVREVEVRATRDWVLFHRRRDKVCEIEEQRPAAVQARRYMVYHLPVDREQAETVVAALRANDAEALADLSFVQVNLVEYAAATPVLRSSPDAVRDDWQAVNPNDVIFYGAIASRGAALRDGEVLARGRLQRLREVLAEITPAEAAAEFEALLQVPERLAVAGTDGSIVLLTAAEIAVTCQSVFRVQATLLEKTKRVISGGGIADIFESDDPPVPKPTALGKVSFQEGTAQALPNSLDAVVTAWSEQGGGTPTAAAVVAFEGDDQAALYAKQARIVLEELGVSSGAEPITSPSALPPDCPSLLLIEAPQPAPEPAIRTGRVLVWMRRDGAGRRNVESRFRERALVMKFNPDGTLADGLPDEVSAALSEVGTLVALELAPAEGASESNAGKRLEAVFGALTEGGLLESSADQQVVGLRRGERRLLTADGLRVDDIIFLQRG
ncbi:hypothetical protein [Nitrococcus mobilis]|uniref:Uncharacterized protein n=1 Tax=Nitrococcus mobilis Nb-231 TaxID=314278 RepID=A4BR00_9GAMM|nr:hypothetical protein [Nitrococcus mobilis]EAR22000.1 hypothetical protein NB231_06416 [Nitrococcus mobilis Nb-231]